MSLKQLFRSIFVTAANAWALVPLRLVLGVIFMAHGSQKLFGMFGGHGLHATAEFFAKGGMTPGLLWATMAGSGEFFGGLLVLLGLLTRFGALNIAIVMAVAIIHVHWGKFFAPSGFEYPLALLGAALALIIGGGGPLSFDAAIQRMITGPAGGERTREGTTLRAG